MRFVAIPRYSSGARVRRRHRVLRGIADGAGANRWRGSSTIVDPPLTLAAHELAHQRCGQQVIGADVQGSQLLSETLAQYGAAMVLEKTDGAGAARPILRHMHQRYMDGPRTRRPHVRSRGWRTV